MSDSQIKVDTGLLREYASRLKKVNSRLKALEGDLEALYRREGLVDIGAVLRSGDIGWSRTIDDAATYLLETAEDFENVEKEICDLVARSMQGEHPFAYFDDGEQPWTIAGGLSQIEGNVLQPGEYGADTTGSQNQAEGSESLGVWESILNPYNDHANPVIRTMQQINDAVMKYNPSTLAADWLIVQPMKAIKSLYLNGLAAGVQAIEGKEITFTPDMTYAQYTAKVAAATGSPDYYKLARDYFAGDSYKQALSQVLNVSPDSVLVGNLSIGAVTLLSTMAEGAADPTSYIGIGEAVALSRGGQVLKAGSHLGQGEVIADAGEGFWTAIKSGGKSSFEEGIGNVLERHGITLDEFNSLRVRNVSTLTVEEKTTLKLIRESIPMPDANTIMQKVIPASDISKYLNGTYTRVGGYVTRAEDVAQLGTYDEIYHSLRLDYPQSSYKPLQDESVGVIRYTTSEASKISIPYGREMGGTEEALQPFTGNGFAKATNGQILPEFKCNGYLELGDGAQLFEISKDGKETLKGIYSKIDRQFIPIK